MPLPLDQSLFDTVATSDTESGPSRRVDCRPTPQLLASSTPSLCRSKVPDIAAQPTPTIVVGPNDSCLIDDDEIMDCVSSSCHPLAPGSSTAIDPTLSSSHWNVQENGVPTIPAFYPLEKASVFVPQASASNVASQITAALQDRSIDATFDAQNAIADCVSQSQVEFRIRLYRSQFSNGIIAEIQRRMGFDISFAQDMYAILDAAEGKKG